MKKNTCMTAVATLLAALFTPGCYHMIKPLPAGLSFTGAPRPAAELRFLRDITYVDNHGERRTDQEVFDAAFSLIRGARRLLVVDMFLYNEFQGAGAETTRALCSELTGHLVAQKRRWPEIQIVVITDPINTVYGALPSASFESLRQAGIPVVMTKLVRLRDSNPLYSTGWRLFCRPLGNTVGGVLPNPFGCGRVTVRSYLALLNFKANHRKVIIADHGDTLAGLITSANPHDASSAHGNTGLLFTGAAAWDLLATEAAVLAFSDGPPLCVRERPTAPAAPGPVAVRIVTEAKIRDSVLAAVAETTAGDMIDLVMFYLADRRVVHALKRAACRGVRLRLVLDPNKDAFGHAKNGIPNRPVAHELHASNIPVRWADTHGEQSHSKLLLVRRQSGSATLILGSANFTRRNLDDLNLETNAVVTGPGDAEVFRAAQGYVDLVWGNAPGQRLSIGYSRYEDRSLFKRCLYRVMERTGMCTW